MPFNILAGSMNADQISFIAVFSSIITAIVLYICFVACVYCVL